MSQPKGKTGNPNGRPKGTPNKVTSELRSLISEFLNDNWESVCDDFNTLEPKDRLAFYEKLMQYAIPKLASTALTTDNDSSISIKVELPDVD